MRNIYLLLVLLLPFCAGAQTGISCTDTVAARIMMGSYNPTLYAATTPITHPDAISAGIRNNVSADSLRAYLEVLRTFKNRNTGSDTVSAVKGIGAARRWILGKFQQFSAANDNRLQACYLQFDKLLCSMAQHRNVIAVLPGSDTSDKGIIVIEAHMDSRCADLCDTACIAEGMEDNGSGTALVIELARVMSKYSYKHTVVFMTTTSEEQGLDGAQAFASYAQLHGIKIRAVMNNDVIGGVICGHTSSPPSCPYFKHIDSTQVRLFSYGGFSSFNKGLCRFIKLEYKEMQLPFVTVPMAVTLMTSEDRTGRGGDHIPFRMGGYTAMRFTSANEAGDANVAVTGYDDRQHTSADSLGADTDGDGDIDEYFVDFNYLGRNTLINGNAAAMAAIGPKTPDFTLTSTAGVLNVNLTTETGYPNYRVGVRTTPSIWDWDTVYTFAGTGGPTTFAIPITTTGNRIVSIASVDDNGTESLFSKELQMVAIAGVEDVQRKQAPIELQQNKPNPADEATMIGVLVNSKTVYKEAYILIKDVNGKEVQRMPIQLEEGMNEIIYDHGYNMTGTYTYSLIVDGSVLDTKRMVFAN